MIFWASAGVMAALVVAVLLRALLAQPRQAADPAQDLAVYRDQLDELDRDQARGLLTPQEREAARIEIQRRILAVGRRQESGSGATDPANRGRWMVPALAVLLPLVSFGLYLGLGNPGLKSQPFAERPAASPGGGEERAEVLAQLDQRLAATPEDGEAWLLKGHLLRQDGEYAPALEAYQEAGRLLPDRYEPRLAMGETLVALANGEVTREARLQFAQVLQLDRANPSARYYAGLAMVQDGLFPEAQKVWSDLLADSPPGANWAPVVEQQLARLNQAMAQAGGPAAPENPPAPGPDSDDMAAAAEMTPEERMAFIRSMVDGLAARLEDEPDDLEGWLRLARSYQVLGEPEQAREALGRAKILAADLPADSPLRAAVNEALRNLPSSD